MPNLVLISWDGARIAYSFLDQYSNYWSMVCVFRRFYRVLWSPGPAGLLHDFEFKIEFLAAQDRRQVELPELSREPK